MRIKNILKLSPEKGLLTCPHQLRIPGSGLGSKSRTEQQGKSFQSKDFQISERQPQKFRLPNEHIQDTNANIHIFGAHQLSSPCELLPKQ